MLRFDWLPDVLRSELLISEKELFADLNKSEHSFLRNLLADTAMNDKYELDGTQRSGADVFDNTAMSHVYRDPAESAELAKQSYAQIASTESKTVGKPCGLIGKGTERGRLRCQISRTNSSVIDDSTDTPLKTPAGFYDLARTTGCLSIPPLFDYSSGLFTHPCHDSDASHLFTDNSMLCSISEDEKWSEGSEISSVDIDASSTSALSPVDFTKDGMMSITEDEEEQEERVVLSVVQNVLSDEAGTLNERVDESMEGDICSDEHRHSPDTSSSENSTVDDSQLPPSTDVSKLNPLARPFTCLPKKPVQPMPVVFTPAMPTVVVPVKFVYTKLVPVGKTKSPSSTHLEKNSAHRSSTPVVSSNTPNSKYQ